MPSDEHIVLSQGASYMTWFVWIQRKLSGDEDAKVLRGFVSRL